MYRKIKWKFTIVSTLSVTVMLLVLLVSVNLLNFTSMNTDANSLLQLIATNGGKLPAPSMSEGMPPQFEPFPQQKRLDTRYFVVYYDENEQITRADLGNSFYETQQTVSTYAEQALQSVDDSAYLGVYKYAKIDIAQQSAIIFLDCGRDIEMLYHFLRNTVQMALLAVVLTGGISYLCSPIAVKPIVSAYDKQKRFITNASHELKTPLTVISANLDVMEMKAGEDKWIGNSRLQVQKLADLINNLVALARVEEVEVVDKIDISLSELAEMVAESYTGIAMTQEKTFTTDIAENIIYHGNEKNISQLFYILLDNAFQYGNEKGSVSLTLTTKQNKTVFSVQNTVDSVEKGSHKEFFDRFYRADTAHSGQTYGFGIGLSIAKAIVTAHKGKITAHSADGKSICMQVTL